MNMHGVSPEAQAAYDRLNQISGGLPPVNSAYRDPEHNAKVGGAKNSQHTHGNAFDFNTRGMTQEQRINFINQGRQAGFKGFGVYDNALHFDAGPERAWGPSHSRDSLPSWANNALSMPLEMGTPVNEPQPENQLNRAMALASVMPRFDNQQDVNNFLF